jgi:hypothetical protein
VVSSAIGPDFAPTDPCALASWPRFGPGVACRPQWTAELIPPLPSISSQASRIPGKPRQAVRKLFRRLAGLRPHVAPPQARRTKHDALKRALFGLGVAEVEKVPWAKGLILGSAGHLSHRTPGRPPGDNPDVVDSGRRAPADPGRQGGPAEKHPLHDLGDHGRPCRPARGRAPLPPRPPLPDLPPIPRTTRAPAGSEYRHADRPAPPGARPVRSIPRAGGCSRWAASWSSDGLSWIKNALRRMA